MKPLELKARLLCEGANPDNPETVDFLSAQNPQKVLRGGLSSGFKVRLLPEQRNSPNGAFPNREFRVNFPLYSKTPVPLKVRTDGNGLVILENDTEIGRAEILRPPEWYSETVEGYPITSIVTQHGDQIVGSVYEGCCLFNTGEQCKFCVIDKSQTRPELRSVKKKSELILKALEVIPREAYRGLGLNGGMTFTDGRGMENMIPLMEKIRDKFGQIPLAVEMTPPKNLDWIQRFADAGGESLMMNLETWDDDIRRKLIPGKSKYCPKQAYLDAFEKALQVLGEGKVSTCFVVGSEPIPSLKDGIKKVVEYGVIPSPISGRYFEEFADYPFQPNANWKEFLDVFIFARNEMFKAGIIPNGCAGHIACGMCDIIGDQE